MSQYDLIIMSIGVRDRSMDERKKERKKEKEKKEKAARHEENSSVGAHFEFSF